MLGPKLDQNCLKTLAKLGCTYAQGYHISKALPAEQFQQWLEKHQVKTINKQTING